MRIGHGYDVHRLVSGRPLILGGIELQSDVGTLGHSDGDAAIHALIDALFGALAMGDIGQHFPDTDKLYENIDSKILLRKCYSMIKDSGFAIGNVDITIILQRPKLADKIINMRKVIASILDTQIENISVKATTEEKLGFTGCGEGVAAHAVVLLEKI